MEKIIQRLMGYALLPVIVALLTWFASSEWFGETRFSQGLTVFSFGLAMACWDLGNRFWRHTSSVARTLFWLEDVPEIYIIPFWTVGLAVCGGGLWLMLTRG